VNRMGPGILLILFFAILAGLAGVYVWKKNSQKAVVVQPSAPKPRVFIVASTDIPSGRVVHSSDFMSVTISPKQLSERVKSWPALLLSDGRQIVNRRVKNPVKQGEPFAPETFYAEGIEPDLTEKLEPGMRAVSIGIPADGLPSKATPGAIVDVLFRTKPDKDSDLPELSRTLIERVQILVIGNNATFGSIGLPKVDVQDRTVTLAVTPQHALLLKATEGHGEFSVALRSIEDNVSSIAMRDLTLNDIFDLPEPEPEPVPFIAEVFRRGQRQTLTFAPQGNLIAQSTRTVKPKKRLTPPRANPLPSDDDLPIDPDSVPTGPPDEPTDPTDMDYRPRNPATKGRPYQRSSLPSSRVTMMEPGL